MAVNLSRIHAFNTGRQYSIKGQRIAFTVLPDGRVMFADVDRNIDGITTREYPFNSQIISALSQWVLAEYDYGRINYGWYEIGKTASEHENMENTMKQLEQAAKAL